MWPVTLPLHISNKAVALASALHSELLQLKIITQRAFLIFINTNYNARCCWEFKSEKSQQKVREIQFCSPYNVGWTRTVPNPPVNSGWFYTQKPTFTFSPEVCRSQHRAGPDGVPAGILNPSLEDPYCQCHSGDWLVLVQRQEISHTILVSLSWYHTERISPVAWIFLLCPPMLFYTHHRSEARLLL